jgi:hypothetical protein
MAFIFVLSLRFSQNVSKRLKTSQNVSKHLKTSQNVSNIIFWIYFYAAFCKQKVAGPLTFYTGFCKQNVRFKFSRSSEVLRKNSDMLVFYAAFCKQKVTK